MLIPTWCILIMQILGTTESPTKLGHALLVTYQNANNIISYWSTNLGLLTEQMHYLGDPTMKDQMKSTKMLLYGWTNISVTNTLQSVYSTWTA